MKFDYGLPAALIGVSIALVQPEITVALSSTEVSEIATQITVQIEGDSEGSGVIIKRSGNTYYVLTCWHVVEKKDEYTIVTPDRQNYSLDYRKVKKLQSGLDLAVVQFNSNKTYTHAQLGNSDTAIEVQ
jgi:S1-C subfamily serine protease